VRYCIVFFISLLTIVCNVTASEKWTYRGQEKELQFTIDENYVIAVGTIDKVQGQSTIGPSWLWTEYPGNRGGGKQASEEEGGVECDLGGITSQVEYVLISSHLDPHRLEREFPPTEDPNHLA